MQRFLIVLFSFICATLAHAEFVEISDVDGRVIDVELRQVGDSEVTFKMRNGREYTIPMERLSRPSRRMVKEWAETANKILLTPSDRIKVYVQARKDEKDLDAHYSGWKDMRVKINPRVLIENQDAVRSFSNLEATLVMLGEDLEDRDNLKVLFKDSFKFDLPPRAEESWEGKPFEIRYLDDDGDTYDNSYGFRYRFYFLVIKNEDGSVGHVAASKEKWTRNPSLIEDLEVKETYDSDLR